MQWQNLKKIAAIVLRVYLEDVEYMDSFLVWRALLDFLCNAKRKNIYFLQWTLETVTTIDGIIKWLYT